MYWQRVFGPLVCDDTRRRKTGQANQDPARATAQHATEGVNLAEVCLSAAKVIFRESIHVKIK